MAAALVLARYAAKCLSGGHELLCVLIGAAALFVAIGFLMPASSLLTALAEAAWMVLHVANDEWSRFLVASILIALTVLGPGAYSIDRWLFGRKRLTIGRPAR